MKSLILALSLLMSFSLLAQEAAKADRPCAEDMQKFCADVKGKKKKAKCLIEHKAELSAACTEKMEEVKTKRKAMRKAKRKEIIENKTNAKGNTDTSPLSEKTTTP